MKTNDYDFLFNLCKFIKLAFEKKNKLFYIALYIKSHNPPQHRLQRIVYFLYTLSILSILYELMHIFFHIFSGVLLCCCSHNVLVCASGNKPILTTTYYTGNTRIGPHRPIHDKFLSYNNPCFQCNAAITKFVISNTCEIRFHDVIGQSTVPMYSYAKILKHGRPTRPNEYVLDPYFSA